jgi:predicted nucleic acid-binding protein
MQKIVIDTNVIVSSLIQRSHPYKIIYPLSTNFPHRQHHALVAPSSRNEQCRI